MNFRRNLGALLTLMIIAVTCDAKVVYIYYEEQNNVTSPSGKPLYITPFLEANRVDVARHKARVSHPHLPNITSYSGYFTVNKTFESNLFFWYFPAREENETTAPVVLFIEGGPGVSSFFSIFLQNGPIAVGQDNRLRMRAASWSRKHHMIYIDSPIGTGYSFTNSKAGYATSTEQVAKDLRAALIQFFKLFPNLRSNDFFVFGESYAGKFAPALSHLISMENSYSDPKINLGSKINLQGMVIANGFIDPRKQLTYGNYTHNLGLVDKRGRDELFALEAQIQTLRSPSRPVTNNTDNRATTLFRQLDSKIRKLTGYCSTFNLLDPEYGRDKWQPFEWVQRYDMRRALHVGDNKFKEVSLHARNKLNPTLIESESNKFAAVLHKYPVLVYNGNLDAFCTYSSTEKFFRQLAWNHAEAYKAAGRKFWKDNENRLIAYVKKVSNLTQVLVRNAGHLASIDQPYWTSKLLEKFTHKLPIE